MATEEFYDTTTRANGNIGTATSGDAWSTIGTSATISSNNATVSSTGNGNFIDVGSSDNWISLKMVTRVTASGPDLFLVTRRADANNYYAVALGGGHNVTAGTIATYEKVAGSLSQRDASIGTFVNGDIITSMVSGQSIHVFKNGALIHTTTDASLTTGTGVGFETSASGTNTWTFTSIHGGTATGTYLPPVGTRMAYDRDGSRVFTYEVTSGVPSSIVERSGAEITELNDEDGATAFSVNHVAHISKFISILFPETRIITGGYITGTSIGNNAQWEYSTDTTNGSDGSWTPITETVGVGSDFRTGMAYWNPISNVKGIRHFTSLNNNISYKAMNVYGTPIASAGVHRVVFWHPYLDIPLPGWYMDLDDVGINTQKTREFRLKNISTTLTANSITVSAEDLTGGTTVSNQMSFTKASLSGAYSSTISFTSLASGALTEVCTMKRLTPSNQGLGLQAPRINLAITSFS